MLRELKKDSHFLQVLHMMASWKCIKSLIDFSDGFLNKSKDLRAIFRFNDVNFESLSPEMALIFISTGIQSHGITSHDKFIIQFSSEIALIMSNGTVVDKRFLSPLHLVTRVLDFTAKSSL